MHKNILKLSITACCLVISSLSFADSFTIGQIAVRSEKHNAGIGVKQNDVYTLECRFRDKITNGSIDVVFNNNEFYRFHITSRMPNSFKVEKIHGVETAPQQSFINFYSKGSPDFTTTNSQHDWTYLTCVGKK